MRGGSPFLSDAVRLGLGMRRSFCAVQHAGPHPSLGGRGVVATWLAVVGVVSPLVSCLLVSPYLLACVRVPRVALASFVIHALSFPGFVTFLPPNLRVSTHEHESVTSLISVLAWAGATTAGYTKTLEDVRYTISSLTNVS